VGRSIVTAIQPRRAGWDDEQRAAALTARRGPLLARLHHKLPKAIPLTADMREFIVDDSIEFAAVHYEHPVHSQAELERVFWDAAKKRVDRARTRRYDLVRGKYQRADLAALDSPASDGSPEDRMLLQAELSAVIHFSALLSPEEREIFRCQWSGSDKDELGAKLVAQELGLPLSTVRNAARSIAQKHERFTAIYTAGRLCGYLAPSVSDLAADQDLAAQALAEGGGRRAMTRCCGCAR